MYTPPIKTQLQCTLKNKTKMDKKAQVTNVKLRSGSQTQTLDSPKVNKSQGEKADKGKDPKQPSITEYQSDPEKGPGEEVKALRKEMKAYFEELDKRWLVDLIL